jgi:AcrR family transcriptional regulator
MPRSTRLRSASPAPAQPPTAGGASPARKRPGPKARIGRADLLRIAERVLDAEGLDAISMRRLASEVGMTPMAVYRHVPSKDALLEALVEHVLSHVDFSAPRGTRWSEHARIAVRSLWRQMHQHPWLVSLLLRGPVLNRGVFRASESAFLVLREAGFDDETAIRVLRVLVGYTVGFASLAIARRGVGAERYREIPADEFPMRASLAPRLGPFDKVQFEFGLDAIIAGLESHRSRK